MLFWLEQGEVRQQVLLALSQPMTAGQLAQRLSMSQSSVSDHVRQLTIYEVVCCLNQASHQSRVYWLTPLGLQCRQAIALRRRRVVTTFMPTMDWSVYGNTCFRHRRTVLLALEGRMRPPAIKRKAWLRDKSVRMSSDNCREVLYWLCSQGVAQTVMAGRSPFMQYELTEVGKTCQELLARAATPLKP